MDSEKKIHLNMQSFAGHQGDNIKLIQTIVIFNPKS